MILDRHLIHILPVSEEQYWRFKGKQKLSPKRDIYHDLQTGYGILEKTLIFSPKQLAREIQKHVSGLVKVNQLVRPKCKKKKQSGIVYLYRKPIYSTTLKPQWDSLSELEDIIYRGRGVDIILTQSVSLHQAHHKQQEEHYYRLLSDGKVYLVQLQIPFALLYDNNNTSKYAFSSKIGKDLDRVVATHLMPAEFVLPELQKRRSPRRGI